MNNNRMAAGLPERAATVLKADPAVSGGWATHGSASPGLVPWRLRQHLNSFWCPGCRGDLEVTSDASALRCTTCSHRFACDGDLPLLYWPTMRGGREDVTELVRAFYEKTPFPDYDDIDSPETLRSKAERGVFARLLNEQIPFQAKILEVGCGTGQLSNFLGLRSGRAVFGTDVCLNSLRLGERFRTAHDLTSVVFLQQDLFRPVFRPSTFDVVISSGVLHHTSDPRLGFQSILTTLKPRGIIIIGLYNTYGRLTTDVRRLLFPVTGGRLMFLDPRLRRQDLNETRKRAWFMDQYRHPHVSTHTIGQVLGWFDESGVEFLNAIPKCVAGERLSGNERLFTPHARGTALDHFVVQLGMLLAGGREGGFFIMIGRKP